MRGRLRRPVRRPSLGYGGSGAVTTPASVASASARSNSLTVAVPTALAPHVPPVLGGVPGRAGRAGWARGGRVYLLHAATESFGFVRAEGGERQAGPRVFQAVVLAGLGGLAAVSPTAGACRAPADASEFLQTNAAHPVLLGHDVARELGVHVAHPAPFFALALAHGPDLPGRRHLLASGVAAAPPEREGPFPKPREPWPITGTTAGIVLPRSPPLRAAAVVGFGSGSAISAIHLPRLLRSTPGVPGGPFSATGAQRMARGRRLGK